MIGEIHCISHVDNGFHIIIHNVDIVYIHLFLYSYKKLKKSLMMEIKDLKVIVVKVK